MQTEKRVCKVGIVDEKRGQVCGVFVLNYAFSPSSIEGLGGFHIP